MAVEAVTKMLNRLWTALLVVGFVTGLWAQAPTGRPAPVISPEVSEDGVVTFRLRGPAASEVVLLAGFAGGEKVLHKGDDGVWTVTLGPLEPGIYDYTYRIDGVGVTDPHNSAVKIWQGGNASAFQVKSHEPEFYDRKEVAHGDVHIHYYDSKSIGRQRRMHVYTPPGYDDAATLRYPVLYLLHGSGDDDSTWVAGGRANFIFDNLISEGAAEPMIVVMTDGHPAPWRTRGGDNSALFEQDVMGDVIPFVDGRYRTKADQRFRAIAGLSMGGGQSLRVGLGNLNTFDYVAAFSSAVPNLESDETMQEFLSDPKRANEQLKLLWVACGKDDFLLQRNDALKTALEEHGIDHTYRLTEGGHEWRVWRDYLRELTPLLFQGETGPLGN